MDFIREYWWLVLIAAIAIAVAFTLLRPRQSVRLTDSAPIRPHMMQSRPLEGRGLAGEAAEQIEGVTVFHAGTALGEGGLVAKGGRVLAVTAVADTFANARARAYRAVDQIDFADGFHRRDIGWRELARETA